MVWFVYECVLRQNIILSFTIPDRRPQHRPWNNFVARLEGELHRHFSVRLRKEHLDGSVDRARRKSFDSMSGNGILGQRRVQVQAVLRFGCQQGQIFIA